MFSLLFLSPFVRADTLVIKTLEYKDCRIVSVDADTITFEYVGRPTVKPIADVTRIAGDNELALAAAEAYFAQNDWDRAAAEYEKAARATTKQWVRDWSSRRLLEAAQKGGRFDVVIRNYVQVALNSPDATKKIVLNMPRADSAYLPDAVKEAAAALDKAATPASQEALARLLIDLQNARGDVAAAEIATRRLAEIMVKAYPNSPDALAWATKLKVAKVLADLDAKKYDQVIAAVNSEAPSIVDPADQLTLLWAMAEARRGNAAAAGSGATKDDWKEIAIAYMRVVAHGGGGGGGPGGSGGQASNPRVIDAFLKVAEIHAAKLDDKPAARAILRRMIDEDYKGMEAAGRAAKMLEEI